MTPAIYPRRGRKHPWQWPWLFSIALHSVAFAAVASSIALAPVSLPPPDSQIQVDGRWGAPKSPETSFELKGAELRGAELRGADADERWTQVIESSREQRTLPNPGTSELSSFVQKQIDRSVADGRRRTASENEDKLSRLGRRLSETSSTENVDQMAEFLGGMVGQRSGSARPGEVARPFDVDTAQIDRVRKEEDPRGGVRYVATLIDAQGATTELELDPESGAQLYKTMKLIESNPLLERIYRKIVMGFLDQMLSKPAAK